MKNKILKVLLIAVLVLLAPFLIGRVSVIVLERVYPVVVEPAFVAECREKNSAFQQKPISKLAIDCIEAESDYLIRSLNRTRAITRTALILVGIYYVAFIAVWFIRHRLRRSRPKPETLA